jgi:hypothetical protein
MWDGVLLSELISPSIPDTSTLVEEEVAARGASTSCVEPETMFIFVSLETL